MEEMKAVDIMIGNYFHISGFPMYIESIFNDTVYLNFDGNEGDIWEEDIKDLKPIPLTEEILLKCGFKLSLNKCCYGMITDTAKSRLSIFPNGTFKVGTEDLEVKVKYLHQLQNLFKVLTGNDLKIEV